MTGTPVPLAESQREVRRVLMHRSEQCVEEVDRRLDRRRFRAYREGLWVGTECRFSVTA